ncbi:MAG: hypothetical protein ACLQVM_18290 [Terriglobia bacterium]
MNYFATSFKALALIMLLGNLNVSALECKAQPAKDAEKKECLSGVICKAWKNFSTKVSAKKAEVIATAKEMKARGWSNWTNKEKVGVVAGGALVAATAGYLVYKAYKAFTAPKVKVAVRSSRS